MTHDQLSDKSVVGSIHSRNLSDLKEGSVYGHHTVLVLVVDSLPRIFEKQLPHRIKPTKGQLSSLFEYRLKIKVR